MSHPQRYADWQQMAADMRFETRAFINDQFVEAVSGETFETIKPATSKRLARVASCDAPDAELAVGHARAAFARGDWSRLAPGRRKKALLGLAEWCLPGAARLQACG